MSMPVRVSEIFLSIQGEGPVGGNPRALPAPPGLRRRLRVVRLQVHGTPRAVARPRSPRCGAGEAGAGLDDRRHGASRSSIRASTRCFPKRSRAGSASRSRRVVCRRRRSPTPRLHYNVSPKLPSATSRWEDTWACDRSLEGRAARDVQDRGRRAAGQRPRARADPPPRPAARARCC